MKNVNIDNKSNQLSFKVFMEVMLLFIFLPYSFIFLIKKILSKKHEMIKCFTINDTQVHYVD